MPNIHKQILNYTGSGYPVVRSNQFKRFADEKWVDENGVLWMRARAFAPPFVETILEPDVREALTVNLPPLSEDAGGAVQFWFLLNLLIPNIVLPLFVNFILNPFFGLKGKQNMAEDQSRLQ